MSDTKFTEEVRYKLIEECKDYTRVTPEFLRSEGKPVSAQAIRKPACCLGNCMNDATHKVELEGDSFTYLCRLHWQEYCVGVEALESKE